MVPFYAGLILLCASADVDQEFLKLIKKIGTTFDIEKIATQKADIECLLNQIPQNKNDFRCHYLKLLLSEIKTFEIQSSERQALIKNISLSFNKNNDKIFSDYQNANNYNELINDRKFLVNIFGEFSNIDLQVTLQILAVKVMFLKNTDCEKYILFEIERFENSSWKGSPLLDGFYVLLAKNCIHHKKFELASKASEKIMKNRKMICDNKIDPIFITPFSYALQSLCGLKKYKDVILEYNKIPTELLESNEKKYFAMIAKIYSSVALSYYETNKYDLACINQEFALSKEYSFVENREHPWVQEYAIHLQTYLAKKGDWAAVRTLEERYNLKPLAKDAKEK